MQGSQQEVPKVVSLVKMAEKLPSMSSALGGLMKQYMFFDFLLFQPCDINWKKKEK